jgi:hypothetical protein
VLTAFIHDLQRQTSHAPAVRRGRSSEGLA